MFQYLLDITKGKANFFLWSALDVCSKCKGNAAVGASDIPNNFSDFAGNILLEETDDTTARWANSVHATVVASIEERKNECNCERGELL